MVQDLNNLGDEQVTKLQLTANRIRQLVIYMINKSKAGHTAGSLGMADIFSSFYFHILKHDPRKPLWDARDRLVLSNGHICPVQYASLALSGYFDVSLLDSLHRVDSTLQGHPKRGYTPGVETTSGPLGEGLAQAIGMALVAKLDGKNYNIYCLTSDGEHQEGSTWEAIMFAGSKKLNSLICVVDRNYIQIDGNTEDVMPLEPLKNKYESFGWRVFEANGNNIREFINAVKSSKAVKDRPAVIIAHTTPGKGVDFMENNYLWHGKAPNDNESKLAIAQLTLVDKKLIEISKNA